MISKTGRSAQLWTKSEKASIHLKRHLHLTNCIHLKHHSHMQKTRVKLELGSPSEALIRELSTLKKSRSLRDPSTSPPWKSGFLSQKLEYGRRKDNLQWQGEIRSLKQVASVPENLGAETALENVSSTADGSDSSEREGWVEISPEDGKRIGLPQISQHHGLHGMWREQDWKKLARHSISGLHSESSSLHYSDKKGGPSLLLNAISSSEVLKQEGYGSLGTDGSHEKMKDEIPSKDEGNTGTEKEGSPVCSDYTRRSRQGNKSTRKGKAPRNRRLHGHLLASASGPSLPDRWNWKSLALPDRASVNVLSQNDELEISEIPQNGCGIPWNWSRIHTKGKVLLDIAGKSVTCGTSDPFTRRLEKALSRSNFSSSEDSVPITSDCSDTSLHTDSESLPLLEHGLQSDTGSPSEGGLVGQSGQDEIESSVLASKRREMRVCGLLSPAGENNHHSFSEKYAPKSFHDIVGQGLITQALSNALSKGRVAPVYIFYGAQGTGKSSCARVFALALNCTSPDQRPCGSCTECLAHKAGKTSIVKEFTAGGLQGTKGIKKLVHEVTRPSSSRYKVFIIDECHNLSSLAWNAFMKAVEGAVKHVVFVLCTSSLEQLPHGVMSRCQKFMFSKIRESEVISRLQMIAGREGLEVDAEALKLVGSACEGSLRDAEMMLDQLSLLGQKITLPMVQELMGLVPDEKLVDLLDFALSADTINTVRNVKELMVSGVEPLNLMSQLACTITSLLAGGYRIPKGRHRRRFFRKRTLAKEDMERLRQALKTLSEAERQLRASSDRTTWLMAALLQFAPDQSYLLPSSSADTSFTQSPAVVSNAGVTVELISRPVELHQYANFLEAGSETATEAPSNGMSSSPKASLTNARQGHGVDAPQAKSRHHQRSQESHTMPGRGSSKAELAGKSGEHGQKTKWQTTLTDDVELEEVWQRVLDAVHSSSLRKFLQTQGRLLSISLRKGFAVAKLEFCQPESTARAERSRTSIAHAFKATLGCPIDVKVQQQGPPAMVAEELQPRRVSLSGDEPRRVSLSGDQPSGSSGLWQPTRTSGDINFQSGSYMTQTRNRQDDPKSRNLHHYKRTQSLEVFREPPGYSKSENIPRTGQNTEIAVHESAKHGSFEAASLGILAPDEKLETAWIEGARHGVLFTKSSSKAEKQQEESTGKSGVSLGFVIQQAEGSVEGYSQDLEYEHLNEGSSHHVKNNADAGFNSNPAAQDLDIGLEEENLRLEPKSGGLLCWKVNDNKGLEKVKPSQESPKRPGFFLSLCPCAKTEHSQNKSSSS